MALKYNFDVKYFFDENNIYFRKGIWNTIDGIIPFNNIENKNKFIDFLEVIEKAKDEKQNEKFKNLSDNDKKLINDLRNNKFLIDEEDENIEICQILTGQKFTLRDRKIDFQLITDMDFIEKQAYVFSKDYNYSYKTIDFEKITELKEINLLNKVDSIDYERKIINYRNNCFSKSPLLIILKNFDLNLMDNLNQIMENVPMFIGFMDGPFMIFLSIIPKQTACWSCFEQRMLSFVKDNSYYNIYKTLNFKKTEEKIYNLHFTQLFHMGLQEVFSWCLLNMSRFMGRCMFTYLPTMEIHFHDLNRIPSCNNCGYISRINNAENNANLNTLVEEYIRNNEMDK